MKKKKYEVKCPAIWSDVPSFIENSYDEIVTIKYGTGYCDNPLTAERLKKFGYTVIDLQEEIKEEL